MENEMPKGGVKELLQSREGRLYLDKLQKRHWKDTLQPTDQRFSQVYGSKIAKDKSRRGTDENQAKSEWVEVKEKKLIEKWDKENPGLKKSRPKFNLQ